ncbi:AlpA family phage regulatory protein [Desulfovibrio sp.]|uniref:helix-turn-helix transcriptional regulator n=1 Tax=Desulfovibrio sp. TaxID=885 RepID=UPI0025885324|nr:AlpA family phage regulatory protein [Desulfovibrio sp.]
MHNQYPTPFPSEGFVRLHQVLQMFPFSRTTLWRKVKAGQFPEPHKLGPRTSAWDVNELRAYKEKITSGELT